MQLEKISLTSQDPDYSRSSGSVEMPSNERGAELEADFLQGNVSAEEEPMPIESSGEKLLKSKERYRAIVTRTPSPRLMPRSPRLGERSPVPPIGQRSPVPPRVQRSSVRSREEESANRDSASSPAIIDPVPDRGSSPTLRRSKLKRLNKLSADHHQSRLLLSSPRALSRCSVSSKRLKEITKDDPRLSNSDVSCVLSFLYGKEAFRMHSVIKLSI